MKLPQFSLRDLLWLTALVACMCGCWSYGGNPVAVLFALACAFVIRFWQIDHLRVKRHRVAMPENHYGLPMEQGSEILSPFLRTVAGFVLGTLVYAVLLTASLAAILSLAVWALVP